MEVFMNKLKILENQFLDDATKNSAKWFGEEMSRDVCKHMFFPILKYNRDKISKKIDYTQAPQIRARIENYAGNWNIEIFDIDSNLIFPCAEKPNATPMDFIPKLSQVVCVMDISQVWIGGKGMGISMKIKQCVVKPREIVTIVTKKCLINFSPDEFK
jgi:hypothetical protein